MRILLTAVLLAVAPVLAVAAKPVCNPDAALIANLAQEWDERPVARGFDERGALLVGPHGIACIATHGGAWRVVPPGAPS